MSGVLFGRGQQIRDLFSAVRGNARVIVVTEGVAAINFKWYATYLSVYMIALGTSEQQVGLLASALVFTQAVSTLLGGYFADRFGRKRVLFVGDIICWGVPIFLYAIARNPWYFLAGRLINGFVYVVAPSFECLFVEDVPVEHRTAVFGMLQLLVAGASLLSPVAGYLVANLGIVLAGRLIMATCTVMAIGIAIARQFTLRETSMGRERMLAVGGLPLSAIGREYLAAVQGMIADWRVRTFLAVRILVSFTTLMWTTYAAIYMTDGNGIGLPESLIALLPFASALATIGMILLAAGRMRSHRALSSLIIGQVLWLVAALAFVASPPKTIWFAVLWAVVGAISLALFQPANQSTWANIVGDRQRALVFSAGSALTALCALPAGPLAGALYPLSPRAPFVLGIGLQVAALGLILALFAAERRDGRQALAPGAQALEGGDIVAGGPRPCDRRLVTEPQSCVKEGKGS